MKILRSTQLRTYGEHPRLRLNLKLKFSEAYTQISKGKFKKAVQSSVKLQLPASHFFFCLLAYLIAYLFICLLACLLPCLLPWLPYCLLPCGLGYFLTCFFNRLLSYFLAYWLIGLLSYLLTCLFTLLAYLFTS